MSIRKTKNKEKIAVRKNKDGYGISDGILIYFIQTISEKQNDRKADGNDQEEKKSNDRCSCKRYHGCLYRIYL